jgi:copper(I)-binding protein
MVINKIWQPISIIFILSLVIGCKGKDTSNILIENPWGRPSPKVASAGAFYMAIKNTGSQDDALISASSPSCAVMELHESYDKGNGVMGMREVDGGVINIPAKSQVELKMGGLHIMCIGMLDEFSEGSILSATLEFQLSGSKTIDIEIRNP